MNIFFTSDQHFGHANIIRHCARPFTTVEEQDEMLIKLWNESIGPRDTVYHLGDIIFRSSQNPELYLKQLNGHIHLLRGNHDKETLKNCLGYFDSIKMLDTIRIDHQKIILCHYAMRVWEGSHQGSWHLYGHSHGNLLDFGRSFDVGVDVHAFKPWTWDEVKVKMAQLVLSE